MHAAAVAAACDMTKESLPADAGDSCTASMIDAFWMFFSLFEGKTCSYIAGGISHEGAQNGLFESWFVINHPCVKNDRQCL